MSRVLAVFEKNIMVKVKDVTKGDQLAIRDNTSDPIIDSIDRNKDDLIRFNYKAGTSWTPYTVWMNPESKVFIQDPWNERKEFDGS